MWNYLHFNFHLDLMEKWSHIIYVSHYYLLFITYYYLLLPLQRFMSDNLIRVSGRFSNSYFSLHNKHQVIIDKTHPLASLFITYIHERNFHCGRESTLSLLRKKYWIIYKKALIRNKLSNSSRCIKGWPSNQMHLWWVTYHARDYPLENIHSPAQVLTSLGHYLSKYVKGLEFLQVQENVLV